jgi:hypothetical protein
MFFFSRGIGIFGSQTPNKFRSIAQKFVPANCPRARPLADFTKVHRESLIELLDMDDPIEFPSYINSASIGIVKSNQQSILNYHSVFRQTVNSQQSTVNYNFGATGIDITQISKLK